MTFHTKTPSSMSSLFATEISILTLPPLPKYTMSSPVVNFKEGMETTKQTKKKIGVGSVVKAKVGELEKITRDGRSSRMRK